MSLAIGIDLGTTNSVCAVWRDGRAEVVPSGSGARLTPSVVAYGIRSGAPLVGQPAVDQASLNPENTIYDVKRLMGRRWDDTEVQKDVRDGRWPFQVTESNGRPGLSIQESGRRRCVLPEQVSAAVLAYVRDSAEAHLGISVRDAVVTVPAYFSNAQRQATKDACTIAGLRPLRIINEPTAAALAYGLAESSEDERVVLVYDWGGGTLDVSLLTIEEGVFEVRATAGDTHLGGTDLDAALADHLAAEFQKRTSRDPRTNPKALRRLLTAAHTAKVTRASFDRLSEAILARALAPVKLALKDAELDTTDVQELLLVGGSTRIPTVREKLQAMFPGLELRQVVSPDEAVALGAAAQAAVLSGDRSGTITDLVLIDVTPITLGVNVHGGIFEPIIPRNTTIPCRRTKTFYTVCDYQSKFTTKVYEGERTMSKDNHFLGEFTLHGITRAPRGVTSNIKTFEIDADGILHVSAEEPKAGVRGNITITNESNRLNSEQIQRFIAEAEKYKEDDKRMKADAEARNALDYSCYLIKKRALTSGTSVNNRKKILDECERTLQWLDDNKNASKQECESKKNELELLCEMILTSL